MDALNGKSQDSAARSPALWHKRIIKTFFPAFRVELGCVFSMLAYILLYRTGQHVAFWGAITSNWKRMNYGDAVGICMIAILVLLILVIPIATVITRMNLFYHFPGLSFQGTTVILLSIYGWMASEHLQQLQAGGSVFGVPVNALLAVIELAEIAILIVFVYATLEFPVGLRAYLGPREPSYVLLIIVCLLGIPTVFIDHWFSWISQPSAALLAVHLCFIASMLWRKPVETPHPDDL